MGKSSLKNTKYNALIAVNLAAVIFGSSALYGKLDISPFWIVAMRAMFASFTLSIVAMIRREKMPRLNFADFSILFFTGVLLLCHWVTFFHSVQISGIAVATLTFATFPLFTVMSESIKSKKIPHFWEILATLIIVVAVSLLIDFKELDLRQAEGVAAGLASALTFSIFGVVSKKLTQKFSSISVSIVQNIIVGLCLMPFLFFIEKEPHTLPQWGALVMLGVINTAVMHQLYLYALKRLSAAICSGFVALEPVYAILFAAVFFNEPVRVTVVVSIVLIFGSSILLLRHEA